MSTFQSIPVDSIAPSPHQARKDFDQEALNGLAESMRHEGLIEPIVVRQVDAGFELISGERRVRAAKLLGWKTIEAKIIATVSEAEAAVKGLIENIQREDLNPIEEAEGFRAIKNLNDDHWTQERIGQVAGKKQEYISRSLALLKLPEAIIDSMRQRILSREHGIELLRINNAKLQKELANKIIEGGLSVKQTRSAIDTQQQAAKLPGIPGIPGIPGTPGAVPLSKDPLAELWQDLIYDAGMLANGPWQVSYGQHNVMGGNSPKMDAWRFVVHTPGFDPRAELAAWFQMMANTLNGVPGVPGDTCLPAGRPVPAKASQAVLKKVMPSSESEFDEMLEAQKHVRLPRNAQEQAELEALAPQGPGPVYAWIWGAGNPLAKKMQSVTWEELHESDPVKACRELVDSMRELRTEQLQEN